MRLSLLAAATLVLSCVAASADPVTYTLTGSFTGTLGALTFTSDPGTITLTSDTASIVDQGGGFFTDIVGTSTIALDGIGSATFLSPSFGAYSSTFSAGFFDQSTGFGPNDYDPLNPAMANYALTSPFTDTGFLLFADPTISELTTLGDLSLTGDFGSAVTFTAAGAATAPTPEPSSLLSLATALLAIPAALRLARQPRS